MRLRLLAGLTLCVAAVEVFAASGTDKIAAAGQPVTAIHDWPPGVVDLLNDPARTDGWHHWFSECPNDVNHYVFVVKDMKDVDRLVQLLGRIKAAELHVNLDPDGCYRTFPHAPPEKPRPEPAAVFAIGSQKILDEWFSRLQRDKEGKRVFGVHRYDKPPTALPPTLTLYVSNEAVDLRKLVVPTHITVGRAPFPNRIKPDATLEAIDRYIADHRARQKAADKLKTGANPR